MATRYRLIPILFGLVILFLSGCETTIPVSDKKKARRATHCERLYNECWEDCREHYRRPFRETRRVGKPGRDYWPGGLSCQEHCQTRKKKCLGLNP